LFDEISQNNEYRALTNVSITFEGKQGSSVHHVVYRLCVNASNEDVSKNIKDCHSKSSAQPHARQDSDEHTGISKQMTGLGIILWKLPSRQKW